MKRLAIFLDGTWNTLNNNTNVWRLKSLTAETAGQRVYYSQGVGTQRGEAARGGITGYGIDEEIIEAYTWLIQNFDEGDEIFIFGFSRGAYTARSLSGLICKCGVLKLGAPLSIEQLYVRYRIYDASTIRSLLAKPLPQNASIEEQWLTKYSRPTKIKFVSVWDTVGSLGLPLGSVAAKVHKYRFLDTHLRLDNENAFHALALDEHRRNFEPTFWTRTVRTGQPGAPERSINNVEQRWFVGAHANVGGGYASDPLAQRPLKWLMDKAAGLGLAVRDQVVIDTAQVAAPITDSYREFAHGLYRFISRPFYRPVGLPPDKGTEAVTAGINETVDGSVFDRWRAAADYRPANLAEWAKAKAVDPAKISGAVLATEPTISVP
jgi:type VI secretion system (T6SS) phospholipase Tle1-like effector